MNDIFPININSFIQVLKTFITNLFVFTILFQSTWKTAIYIDFKWRQVSIAQQNCVQRNIENSVCKGSCYLKSLLQKSENQENNTIPEILRLETFQFLNNSFYTTVVAATLQNFQVSLTGLTFLFPDGYFQDTIQPPEKRIS